MVQKKKTARQSAPGVKGKPLRKRRGSLKQKPGLFIRFIKSSSYWGFVLAIWGLIGLVGVVAFYGAKLPSATNWAIPKRPPNIKIISYDGQIIANRGVTGGQALSLNDISPYIPQAVISIEDRRFYSHFGLDPIGLVRAFYTNLVAARTVQGGSTLTQQLAKNLFLSPQRTLERKIQEVILSIWLEQKFSKDQILEMYLNRVYFGSGAYGIEAAAYRYFDKPASNIHLAEAALLAGLLKAPSRLSPARNPDLAKARSQVVLKAMERAGFIDDQEAITALSHPQARVANYWTGSENFAADRVMNDLKKLIDKKLIGDVKQDLIIETTLDLDLQKRAEKVLRDALDKNGRKFSVKEGAIIAIDAGGAIQVLIGGRNYATSQFDRASEALRQPGSAFKPFVYTAALEHGQTARSIYHDGPIKIGNWAPKNHDQTYHGPVSLSFALSKSLNTIAARLVMEIGPENIIRTAHRLGIETRLKANASIALGTSEVTLLELTSSYAPFMNGGFKATPHIIKRVSTINGKLLYQNVFDRPIRVISPDIARQMSDMLTEVVRDGTGHRAQIDNWRVAGKTGTSQAFRDALFIGYTSNLTAGVWLGNDSGKPTKRVTGGGLPAQIWQKVMSRAHDNISLNSRARTLIPVPDISSDIPSDIPVPYIPVPNITNKRHNRNNPFMHPPQEIPPLESSRSVPASVYAFGPVPYPIPANHNYRARF